MVIPNSYKREKKKKSNLLPSFECLNCPSRWMNSLFPFLPSPFHRVLTFEILRNVIKKSKKSIYKKKKKGSCNVCGFSQWTNIKDTPLNKLQVGFFRLTERIFWFCSENSTGVKRAWRDVVWQDFDNIFYILINFWSAFLLF